MINTVFGSKQRMPTIDATRDVRRLSTKKVMKKRKTAGRKRLKNPFSIHIFALTFHFYPTHVDGNKVSSKSDDREPVTWESFLYHLQKYTFVDDQVLILSS